jgi:hypothetical protein
MKKIKNLCLALLALGLSGAIVACNNNDDNSNYQVIISPAEILASTPWETTNAKNHIGENVPLTDSNVSNFVGYAYFKSDGTFTMYNLDDSPKMKGDWSVPPNGKTRTIVAKNDAGDVLFTRVVDITVLTKDEFTYRIFPDNNNRSIYYDIVHKPTTHSEPQ